MRNKILIAALLLVSLLCAGFARQASGPRQWEYQTFHIPLDDSNLNKLGSQGWELIQVETAGRERISYFKRQK